MLKFALVIVVLGLMGCATQEAKIAEAVSLTPEHFLSTATIKDDPLDTTITITTVKGFQEKRGLLGIVWNDNFLRAFVDKKSRKATFQLYQIIHYQAPSWNFYQTANFETPSGPQQSLLTAISRDVDCAGSSYGGCNYIEHVAFDIDESLLRDIAKKHQQGQSQAWKFKFNAKSGEEYKDGILAAEVVGFLKAVDGQSGVKSTANVTALNGAITAPDPSQKPALPLATKYGYAAENASFKQGCSRTLKAESVEAFKEIYSAQCAEGKKIFIVCGGSSCVVQ